jgi:hypothetical protein
MNNLNMGANVLMQGITALKLAQSVDNRNVIQDFLDCDINDPDVWPVTQIVQTPDLWYLSDRT